MRSYHEVSMREQPWLRTHMEQMVRTHMEQSEPGQDSGYKTTWWGSTQASIVGL